MEKSRFSHGKLALMVLLLSGVALSAKAGAVDYVDWTQDARSGSTGTIYGTLFGGSVNVTYSGEIAFDQLNNSGTYFYTGSSYTSNAVVSNTPSTSDLIGIEDIGTIDTFTFSKPVKDPVMLLVSLGQPSIQTTYYFNQSFTILSDGPGWWGGPGTLLQPNPTTLVGIEGDGAIEFNGTFSSISFGTANGEYWNGFTLGAPASQGVPDTASTLVLLAAGLLSLGFWKFRMAPGKA